MARTKLERVNLADPGVAAFRISGKLGFHENKKIQNLLEECRKRDFKRVVFDFSELSSLGGGVAKILREFAGDFGSSGGSVAFVVTSDVVLQFLRDDDIELEIRGTMEEALGDCRPSAADPAGDSPAAESEPERDAGPKEPPSNASADTDVILMAYDGDGGQEPDGEIPTAPGEPTEAAAEAPVDGETRAEAEPLAAAVEPQAPETADSSADEV
ncbi:MAG TPA: STAS domain-containing protein, partial [Candidatus Eisenbacteria bacterium]|nr:STAS domain-containing protein [Candidatus Eisenbacteria bacterium]